jgi:hypothetical protein
MSDAQTSSQSASRAAVPELENTRTRSLWADAFRRLVKAFTDGPAETAELMCHPGEGSATTLRASLQEAGYRSPWDFHWATELDLLCSGEARRFVESLGVDIVTYRDLDGARDSGGAGQ